jgi:hypothetical protein
MVFSSELNSLLQRDNEEGSSVPLTINISNQMYKDLVKAYKSKQEVIKQLEMDVDFVYNYMRNKE